MAAVPLEYMAVSPPSQQVNIGDVVTLIAATLPADVEFPIIWSSSKPEVASVDENGVVTALSPGTASIMATYAPDPSRWATGSVFVHRPAPTGVAISPQLSELAVGATGQALAAVLPELAYQQVVWSSSNPRVAVVDRDGVITAKAPGATTITATTTTAEPASGRAQVLVGGVSAPFSDVSLGDQFYTEMDWVFRTGVSTGWVDEAGVAEFRPLSPVNRDAMAAFLYRLADSPAFTAPPVSPFVDVATTDLFYKEISWLYAEGISTGWAAPGDATRREFRPLAPVARDAMAAFLFRFADSVMGLDLESYATPEVSLFGDVATDNMYHREISWLRFGGISYGWPVEGGQFEFRPYTSINRDAMAKFMFELILRHE